MERYVGMYNDPAFLEKSKIRLGKIIDTKLRTTFIGALDRFEKEFGYLWGHEERQPTIQQQEMARKWARVREGILTNGNNQMRNLKKELEYYDVKWNRYHIEFKVRSGNV